jgi:hypothetical protein
MLHLLAGVLMLANFVDAQSRVQDVTCQAGGGEYTARFVTGASVVVGPVRSGAFAERACAAKLVWKGQEITVASDAGEVGIDVLGADLGFGKPVVALQIDESGGGTRREYRIYSLTKTPSLLHTIKGGDWYSASDSDLDGRVEIWTDDAAAVDGFERIPAADLDFAPTVVLRIEKGREVDAGSEFEEDYDAEIAKLRSQTSEGDLAAFKQSDGVLKVKTSQSGEELHRLMRTKIRVLEIVWSYLYSGREEEAWSALGEMWPAGDVDRIRAAIAAVHQGGILHDAGKPKLRPSHKHRAKIYDAVDNSVVVSSQGSRDGVPNTSAIELSFSQPKSILLRRPPPSADGPAAPADEMVELVVDAAGKVRSAKVVGGTDKPLVDATAGWQFIPAFNNGSPVACRFRLSLGSYR